MALRRIHFRHGISPCQGLVRLGIDRPAVLAVAQAAVDFEADGLACRQGCREAVGP